MELPFLPDRDYFTMREAARLAQVPAHTLRYWESRFGDLRPSRLAGGHRRYTRADLELILEIKDLVHRRKLTVAGARRALIDKRRGGPAPAPGAAPADGGPALKLLREVKKEIRMLLDEFGR
ncbi:MAG: MerR family transcriptional regulator [Elusimicrobia bacterium]|nr:MerR family transcriptional regulator [Elusimicrobiota bacterium]